VESEDDEGPEFRGAARASKRAALDDSAMGNDVSSKKAKHDKDKATAGVAAPHAVASSPASVATSRIPRRRTSTITNNSIRFPTTPEEEDADLQRSMLASIDSANQVVTPVPFVLPLKTDCHSNDTQMARAPATGNGEDEESRGHEANTNEEEWENDNEWDSDNEKVVDLWKSSSKKIEEAYITVDPIVQQHALTPEA
jgi:hypothetical protein